jgi:hypothetical protein
MQKYINRIAEEKIMEFDDKFYIEEIFNKMDEDSQKLIKMIAEENKWSIVKATKFLSWSGMQSLMSKFENENNGLN